MCHTYLFLNTETGEEISEFMTISGMEEYLASNPHIQPLMNGAPMLHSGRGLGRPDSGFTDLLKDMKKKHSGGLTKSTINTF